MAPSPDGRIAVGLVRGVHGLRGAVRVEVLSDAPDRFAVGSVLFIDGENEPLTVCWTGPAKPGLLVRFSELPARESVERLRDRYLEAEPAPLPPETWFWHDIIGLEARTTDGEVLGTVRDVFRAGAGEVYVVRDGSRGELLVPAVRSVVAELSPAEGRLVVDPRALGLDESLVDAPDSPEVAQASDLADAPGSADAAQASGSADPPAAPDAPDVRQAPEPLGPPEPPRAAD